jgi:uncharacterized protein (TIGR00725 family)
MKTSIGVMGSSAGELSGIPIDARLAALAARLGRAIADRQCVLVTGATSGLPHLVSLAAQSAGAMTIGISPAVNQIEHRERYNLPIDGFDVVIYTGFGLKGRNVVNIRSSDLVIIVAGSTGTLNEFTIAFDEGKIIGVLTGTGGVADHVAEVIRFCGKQESSRIIFNENPEVLVDMLLTELRRRSDLSQYTT